MAQVIFLKNNKLDSLTPQELLNTAKQIWVLLTNTSMLFPKINLPREHKNRKMIPCKG